MTSRLKLVCHGSTAALRRAAFAGDEPLDEIGLRETAALANRLGHAGRYLASPALAARQTAECLQFSAKDDSLLRDCAYGRWTGRSFADVQAQEPEAAARWLRDPAAAPHGGESIADVLKRTAAWLDAQAEYAGETVAVTHAAVIRAAVIHAIGAPPQAFWRIDIAPLSLTALSGRGGRWNLAAMGPMKPRQGCVEAPASGGAPAQGLHQPQTVAATGNPG